MNDIEKKLEGGDRLATLLIERRLATHFEGCNVPQTQFDAFMSSCFNTLCILVLACVYDEADPLKFIQGEAGLKALTALSASVTGPFNMEVVSFSGDAVGIITTDGDRMLGDMAIELRDQLYSVLPRAQDACGMAVKLVLSAPGYGLGSSDYLLSELGFCAGYVVAQFPDEQVITELMMLNQPTLMADVVPKTELERRFADSILELNFQKALGAIEDLMNNEMSSPILSMTFRTRVSKRLDWVLMVLRLTRSKGDSDSLQLCEYPNHVLYAASFQEVRRIVADFFQLLDKYYMSIRFNVDRKIDNITEFIRVNYSDPAMSATLISNSFRISSSYLSHMFRQKTGVKLIDFIHNVRLQEARSLLLGSQLSVSQIAARTGYVSASALVRTFRRYEGMTPSEYRRTASGKATGQ